VGKEREEARRGVLLDVLADNSGLGKGTSAEDVCKKGKS